METGLLYWCTRLMKPFIAHYQVHPYHTDSCFSSGFVIHQPWLLLQLSLHQPSLFVWVFQIILSHERRIGAHKLSHMLDYVVHQQWWVPHLTRPLQGHISVEAPDWQDFLFCIAANFRTWAHILSVGTICTCLWALDEVITRWGSASQVVGRTKVSAWSSQLTTHSGGLHTCRPT